MSYLWLDIETYSSVDLKKTGVYPYAASDDFEILFCWWTTDGVDYYLAEGAEEIDKIPGLWDPSVTKVAHNAPFERICYSEFMHMLADLLNGPVQAKYLDPDPAEWLDTAAWAASLGLPRGLDKLAKALGIEQKDSAGTRLINWFCKPDPKTGKRRMPEDHPEKWEEFLNYGRQDVVVLYGAHQALIKAGEWPDFERQVYYVDQVINDRGIAVDVETARAAVEADAINRDLASREMQILLDIANANSTQQIMAGLDGIGLCLPDLKAETVSAALELRDLTQPQRRALQLRQQLALSSAKKYEAIILGEVDGRIHGQFAYHGAHTGRWAGRGVQLQNLPRHVAKWVLAVLLDLAMGLGASPEDLKGLIRACLLLNGVSVDYNAIEARILAWLAGEEWALKAFRDGADIYVEQAARSSAILRVEFGRQDGKTQVLGLGYQGSIGALRRMGAEGTDEELLGLVRSYRLSNRKIVAFWARLEHAFKVGGRVGHISVERRGRDRHIILPSGRRMIYHDVRITGQDERISFVSNLGVRTATYGGMICENVCQAVARDILAAALVRLNAAGYEIVGHVHDEVLIQGTWDVETVAKIMCWLPEWADGLPLAAEGAVMDRYRK